MNSIYLIRHGETEWAKNGRHTGRTDIPLTDTGREQAGFLLPIFDDVKFARILSSPLQRALETAKLAGLSSRVELDKELLEWDYGDYEGLTTQQIRDQVSGGASGHTLVLTEKRSTRYLSGPTGLWPRFGRVRVI